LTGTVVFAFLYGRRSARRKSDVSIDSTCGKAELDSTESFGTEKELKVVVVELDGTKDALELDGREGVERVELDGVSRGRNGGEDLWDVFMTL
jgi:hypothetical protein